MFIKSILLFIWLVWDNVKRARYNFFWTDVTTFLPYEAETSYESSLLVQRSGALALLSLQNVFASLTSNAKAIYILLVKYQLENNGHTYSGWYLNSEDFSHTYGINLNLFLCFRNGLQRFVSSISRRFFCVLRSSTESPIDWISWPQAGQTKKEPRWSWTPYYSIRWCTTEAISRTAWWSLVFMCNLWIYI